MKTAEILIAFAAITLVWAIFAAIDDLERQTYVLHTRLADLEREPETVQ